MERNDIIKIIPEPKNEDVIVYDLTLKNLIGINIFEQYYNDLSLFDLKKERYILLKNEADAYKKNIDSNYLYNKNWAEADYIEALKNDKKTYSTMFGEVKKIENNIEILVKKITNMNEQIEIQRSKETKEFEQKKNNLDNEIQRARQNINSIENKIYKLKTEQKIYNDMIEDSNEEIELCQLMQEELSQDKYECKYCGTVITNGNSKKRVRNVLDKNITKVTRRSNKLLQQIQERDREISNLQKQLAEHKTTLKNDLEFKKADYSFYAKKSVKILEMEAARNELQSKLAEQKNQYEKNKQKNTKEYMILKDRMSKYEKSLESLEKNKEGKKFFSEEYSELNTLKEELKQLYENLCQYKKFIEIYFKIYEQKASDYFGNDIKFKLFQFDNFKLKEIFNVYYKGTEYSQLSQQARNEFDNIYSEKIISFL